MTDLRFDNVAKAYGDHRPSYPAEVNETILREAGVDRFKLAVDVGAGAGASLHGLEEISEKVIAVEPSEEMRSVAQRNFPDIEFRDGTAEETGLEANSVDLITVVTAFHWFDREKALDEFHRILKPGSWVVLYRYDFPIIKGKGHLVLHRHMTRYWRKYMTRRLTDYDDSFEMIEASALYENVIKKTIDYDIPYEADDFAEFFRSTSYASRHMETLDDPDAYIAGLAAELEDLHPEGFRVAFDLDFVMARKPLA